MNYRRAIEGCQENRDWWLEMLNKDPDNLQAAQFIVTLNAQIQLLKSYKMLEGDCS